MTASFSTTSNPLPSISHTQRQPLQRPQSSQTTAAVEDILFGSVAGSIGKIFEYPFDTIKVRLQSQRTCVYKNSWDCFQKSVRSDGVFRGLYRGLSAPIVGAAVETSSLFFSYRLSQDWLLNTAYRSYGNRDDLPMDALLLAGSISGAFTSLWLTPIELVKCQMQVPLAPGSVHGPGVISVIGNILRHKGPAGFWHGQMGTLFRETGGSAAWFGVYEGFKKIFKSRNGRNKEQGIEEALPTATQPQLLISQRLVAGAAAGVAYNFAFFPADTIKSRMQTESVGPAGAEKVPFPKSLPSSTITSGSVNPSSKTLSPNFWTTARIIWREAGIRGLYRGCGITVARSTLSSPIIFGIYESLKGWREEPNLLDE